MLKLNYIKPRHVKPRQEVWEVYREGQKFKFQRQRIKEEVKAKKSLAAIYFS